MKFSTMSQFIALTIILGLGLGAIIATAYRAEIERNWDHYRCDPGVVLIAKSFKPATDPRTTSQFAEDNWTFCQKEYVQNAIREAAALPKQMAAAEADTVAALTKVADTAGDIFVDVWNFIYEAYSAFMDQMKNAAKLFQNMLLNMKAMVDRLQASILAIVYSLISLVTAFVNTVRVVVIVAIVIIGILIGLSILIMWFFPPIFILTDLMMALAVTAVVAIGVELAEVEGFQEGHCFATGTSIVMENGTRKLIERVQIGDVLSDGAEVTATHQFLSADTVFNLYGIHVTGDHLVYHGDSRISVRDHPDAVPLPASWNCMGTRQTLWCLTTTTRKIPCLTDKNKIVVFADWEEIDAEDEESLKKWYAGVWASLNGRTPLRKPTRASLNSEAAISPACRVEVQRWTGSIWIRASEVRIGDRMILSPTESTEVVGIVHLDLEEVDTAVALTSPEGDQIVSLGTWVLGSSGPGQGTLPPLWAPPIGLPVTKERPDSWLHFYTDSGRIRLGGNWMLRDASDVGHADVRRLVEKVVLESTDKIGSPR